MGTIIFCLGWAVLVFRGEWEQWCTQKLKNVTFPCPVCITELGELVGDVFNLRSKEGKRICPITFMRLPAL